MRRRHFMQSLFAASVMTTAIARKSVEATVGRTMMPRAESVVLHVNSQYWSAPFEEIGVFSNEPTWRTLLRNSGKSISLYEERLPRRYETLEDGEAEVNAIPPYLVEKIDLFTGEVTGNVPDYREQIGHLWDETVEFETRYKSGRPTCFLNWDGIDYM